MPDASLKSRSLLRIHLAVFLFGFPGLFGKWLALTPPALVFGRVVVAALALFLYLTVRRQPLAIRPRSDLLLLMACGLILAVHWSLFFRSIQVASVAVGLLAYSSFPVFTAILEPLAFKERRDAWSLPLASLCLLGVFLIVPAFSLDNVVFQGVLWGLGAGLTFAVLTLLNRALAQRQSSLAVAFYQDFFAAVFLLPFVRQLTMTLSVRTAGLLVLLGIFGTAAAHSLFISGMRTIPARTASIISSLEPVYGIALARIFLNENPSPRTLAGGVLILAAAFWVTVRAGRPA